MEVFVPFFIACVMSLIVFLTIIGPALARREKRIQQAKINQEIERDLRMLITKRRGIEDLAQHSDYQRLAKIIAGRILEYIEMGIAPMKLAVMIQQNLMLDRETVPQKLAPLVDAVRRHVLEGLSGHTLNVYMYTACCLSDHKAGLEKLNQSFLTQGVSKDSFVMNLKLA